MRPRDRWARRIEESSGVPRIFRDFMPGHDTAFPYTIYAPADRWGWKKRHPKLVCLHAGCLTHLELGRSGVVARTFPLAGITCVEMGRVLLRAWIKISGRIAGKAVTVGVDYNSVVEPLFQQLSAAIRAAAAAIPRGNEENLRLERAKFCDLAEMSYKYANFARDSIMPGEKVLGRVFEPGTVVQGLLVRRIARPAQLLVLTDRELIRIRDEWTGGWRSAYGGIWSYTPLGRIERFEATGGEAGGGPILSVRLTDGQGFTARFSPGNGENLLRLAERLAAARAATGG